MISKNNSFTEFLLYKTPDKKVKVEVFLRNENIWLTQDKIAQLFGVQRPAITKHLKNIFDNKNGGQKKNQNTTPQFIFGEYLNDI